MFGRRRTPVAATLKIDTLKFARKLTDAGMERQVAEAVVEGLADADTSDLATKADLAELKAEMFRFMLVQAVAIVGLTVALIKLLP
jgi:hypothetical protein